MGGPLVSIVLPVYNGAAFVAQSIESCLAQTYVNFELIVVDDASTDGTPALVQEFVIKEPRVRLLRHAANRKISAALNTGFEQAKGEYLTWTSADNMYRPHALERMLRFFETSPETDFVYAGYSIIEAGENIKKKVMPRPACELPFRNVIGACFLYRRKVMESVGRYAEGLYGVEDYDFWLRVFAVFRPQPLAEDLYLYRRHSESVTADFSRKGKLLDLMREKTQAKNLPALNHVGVRCYAEAYWQLARNAGHDRRYWDMSRYLLTGIFYSRGYFLLRYGVSLLKAGLGRAVEV